MRRYDDGDYAWLEAIMKEIRTLKSVVQNLSERESILIEAMCEIKATIEGKSQQPVASVVNGCIYELRQRKGKQ